MVLNQKKKTIKKRKEKKTLPKSAKKPRALSKAPYCSDETALISLAASASKKHFLLEFGKKDALDFKMKNWSLNHLLLPPLNFTHFIYRPIFLFFSFKFCYIFIRCDHLCWCEQISVFIVVLISQFQLCNAVQLSEFSDAALHCFLTIFICQKTS